MSDSRVTATPTSPLWLPDRCSGDPGTPGDRPSLRTTPGHPAPGTELGASGRKRAGDYSYSFTPACRGRQLACDARSGERKEWGLEASEGNGRAIVSARDVRRVFG